MKTETEISNYIMLLCEINPNNADLGAAIRKHYGKGITKQKNERC